MVVTPWGDSETLREGMLSPGPSSAPGSVAENQRQRLFGAMVASVAERGYANTRVADLVEASGVSLRSFYDLFPDKQACFLGAVRSLLGTTIDLVLNSKAEGDWAEETTRGVQTAASLVAVQAAASRMCLVETYVAGAEAVELADATMARIEALMRERLAGSDRWGEMPPEIATVALGAVLETFRSRLIGGQAERVPAIAEELTALLLGYEPPARPLRAAARPPELRPEQLEASDHAERALRAFEALLTEQSYAETTMEQVAKAAKMSVRTLYANFEGREELMLAAVDSAGAQLVAAALPAYRRHPSPPEGVRAAVTAMLRLLSSRPNLAHLLLVAVYEGGAPSLQRRAEALRPLEFLLMRAAPNRLAVSRAFVAEALLGGLLWLARRRLIEAGPGALPGLTPLCTYVVLAPLLGAEQATAAAEGKSYRRSPRDGGRSLWRGSDWPQEGRVLIALSQEPLSVAGLVERTSLPREEVEQHLARLEAEGSIEEASPAEEGRDRVLQSRWPVWDSEEWERLDQTEREAASGEITLAMREEIDEAIAGGTFDARPERWLVRLPLWVDEQGWQELHDALTLTFDECFAIQRRIRERLDKSGNPAGGFPARIHLVSFEAPPPEQSDGV
jgi:AcrR family transcriptional regulator/DNA-binding transcriptional ArsR family regulator